MSVVAQPWFVGLLVSAVVCLVPRRAGTHPSRAGGSGVVDGVDRMPEGRATPARGLVHRLVHRLPRRTTPPSRPDAEQVSSTLVLLALAYRSGLPTWQVLTAVSDQSPPLVARDLRQVAAAVQWGADEREAWASVDDRWAPAARAVMIAHRAGVAPGALLMAAADDTRRADLERIEVAAAQVGVRLVAPLGLVLLPAFLLTAVVPLVVSLGRQLLASG